MYEGVRTMGLFAAIEPTSAERAAVLVGDDIVARATSFRIGAAGTRRSRSLC
jgi:hypothetical protein